MEMLDHRILLGQFKYIPFKIARQGEIVKK